MAPVRIRATCDFLWTCPRRCTIGGVQLETFMPLFAGYRDRHCLLNAICASHRGSSRDSARTNERSAQLAHCREYEVIPRPCVRGVDRHTNRMDTTWCCPCQLMKLRLMEVSLSTSLANKGRMGVPGPDSGRRLVEQLRNLQRPSTWAHRAACP
ncbi:hypothetical protein DENSPDRAFT_142992 [Dentipellis sp. KUC8613]|nr:hypothetical protein DENSPDRAFT_142992 [Dentipellis sp. KUC8613]